MKIERRDGGDERRILTGMITDRRVLGKLIGKWTRDRFQSKWANLVGGWCVSYFERYNRAPRKQVEALFESWAEKTKDTDTVKLVETFLSGLSGEYVQLAKQSNPDHLADLAANHFNKVRLARLAEGIQTDLANGDLDAAETRRLEANKIELGLGAGINALQDTEAIREAFTQRSEPLITFGGALGKFFGHALERDGFVGLWGPEKRGKTFWLAHIAWQALLQRRRVAFFEVGDMSQNQIMRRFMVRAARHPLEPCTVRKPRKIWRDKESKQAEVEFIEREFKTGLKWRQAAAACEKVMNDQVKSDQPFLKISCHPNSTINVAGIVSMLEMWERDGWVCDVVVIDYADILANPLPGNADPREQINTTWKQLRALSQSRHCLVVTASQTDAGSYGAKLITRKHFSEDKRKLAHVTGMIGLNQTPEEQEVGITRLNWVALREGKFSEGACCHVAGCLELANPAVLSTF